jgi:signal transduction histidine kinase
VVSHELRTPLNAIAGWTRILRTENLSANTRKLALEKIDKNLRQQTKLVEEVIDYSQILSGSVEFKKEKIDFSSIFEEVFGDLKSFADDRKIALTKDNQLNGQLISGDGEKLRIVVYNLLTNALKFTPRGGRVETEITEKNGTVRLTIKDNGKGISEDFMPRIFDRFTQDDSSTTRSYGGLGLGLSIARHIVNFHEGRIEATSEGSGKGSVFVVELPFADTNESETK